MDFYKNYLYNMSETPRESYTNLVQESINSQWINTTQLRTIKEQSYPFTEVYTEYEAWVDSVSDISVNTNKNIVDFISIMFKDIDHKLNHRGQKYLYKTDGESENVYICYDKMNALSQVSDFKCVRCNNSLTWLATDGSILKEPCYIGEELTSTNNQISKDVTVPNRRLVCMIQGNKNTKSINLNQRFILSHKQAFKITEMNIYSQDDYNSEVAPLFIFYIEWTTLLEEDNLELNIADYYNSDYTLEINQPNISTLPSSSGSLSATVELNGSVVNVPLTWASSNTQVATIDESGNYTIVGINGQTCTITCTMQNNEQVLDSITISVADTPSTDKVLTIMPSEVDSIKMNTSKQIYAKVYLNGIEQADVVSVALSGSPINCYSKVDITDGIEITCLKSSSTPLQLTFTSGSLTKTMTIKLVGLL